ncbi:hypothetical protein PANT_2d00040 [Moesziomyces antarcticus T-34]|uniref:Uncharacterized protein n=1 Tax=Pseudozyma antarctica (strain T-34) TaxID=1151754 RepID=M9MBZ5_PSEA3|nr:hypothetical protein PANT_2d00040 [Moesziomyces antarcticus T-34]
MHASRSPKSDSAQIGKISNRCLAAEPHLCLPPAPSAFTLIRSTSQPRLFLLSLSVWTHTMYCLRWWIPLFLLPFPHTSPLFLVLFLVSFALHSQPCIYCALILTGLFTTSSNWYGPASTIVPAIDAANDTAQPRASYGWIDLGLSGGNGFFNPMARPRSASAPTQPADEDKVEGDDFFRLTIPWSDVEWNVPKRFHVGPSKHQGLGFWIDLGSKLDSPPEPAMQAASTPSLADTSSQHEEL